MQKNIVGKEFNGVQMLSSLVIKAIKKANNQHIKNREYKKKIYTKPSDMATLISKKSGTGFIVNKDFTTIKI